MFGKRKKSPALNALGILMASGPLNLDVERRAKMTISCRDTEYISKVKNAGQLESYEGQKVQIMHNGTRVLAGGYYGEWMQDIIKQLKGHHEPQEEKSFYEVLKRINRKNPVIMELGSYWSYYSLWFKAATKGGVAICCEPDPQNIKVGKANMSLNNYDEGEKLIFIESAAGPEDAKKIILEHDAKDGGTFESTIRTVDSIFEECKLSFLDVLHMDVQGAEFGALKGATEIITAGKLRFLVVSTHHYAFSGDPMTHQKCEQLISELGGHIVASHNVVESFSGDGLIVASFDKADEDFHVDISVNTGPSLFRPYELDIAVMIQAYDKAVK